MIRFKFLTFAYLLVLLVSCTKKDDKESVNKTFRESFVANECIDSGTPYITNDNCTKQLWGAIYRDGITPGTGKNFLWVSDTLLCKTHWYTKNLFLDSLKNPYTAGTSDYLLNIDANGKIGVSNWNTLKIPYVNITGAPPSVTPNFTAGNRISITGTYPNQTISYIEPTVTVANRTVNSNYTISSTKRAEVYYTVTCSVTNPLLVGTSSASAFLEYSLNSGTTWVPASSTGNSSGVGLTVTVQLTNGQTSVISGSVPANALTRIRTTTSGTASVTFVSGLEVY